MIWVGISAWFRDRRNEGAYIHHTWRAMRRVVQVLRNCVHMHATGGDSVCLCTEHSYQSYDMRLEHNGVIETNRIFL